MILYHVITFMQDKKEGGVIFTAAIAENHNVAVYKVIKEDKRIDKDKIAFIAALNSEQVIQHLKSVKKLITDGQTLAANNPGLLTSNFETTN